MPRNISLRRNRAHPRGGTPILIAQLFSATDKLALIPLSTFDFFTLVGISFPNRLYGRSPYTMEHACTLI